MLVILPPSETKVSGGEPGTRLDLATLSFPVLNPIREALVAELEALSRDSVRALRALKLGPKGLAEVEKNLVLTSSPVLPVLSRYTGVLFDALDSSSLDDDTRARAMEQVAVFSALFGLVRASDRIPAYRLSFDSALPGGKPVARWAPHGDELWASVDGFVMDLRSEGYRSLAPVPEGKGVFLRLVKPGPLGGRLALGHHNKAAKGRFVRGLVSSGDNPSTVAELVDWGQEHGHQIDPDSHQGGVIDLVVDTP
jgi:cytoplasmic iron level regulating protein YaaA (DUF328/UPF0246 family)